MTADPASSAPGLRGRKAARTRAHIAATAARVFAEQGFEKTTVLEVARRAEVSEQTVYNHFRVKDDLVLDRDQELRDRYVAAVRGRERGTSPATALRGVALALADDIGVIPADELRGTLGHLAITSRAVHRLVLESTDRLAASLAQVLVETGEPAPRPLDAEMQGAQLAWLSQMILDRAGRLISEGQDSEAVAGAVRADIIDAVDRLDQLWSEPQGSTRAR